MSNTATCLDDAMNESPARIEQSKEDFWEDFQETDGLECLDGFIWPAPQMPYLTRQFNAGVIG